MSIELGASIRISVPLADVLAHAEATIAKLSRPPTLAPLVIAQASHADLLIGPFPLPDRVVRPESYANPWTFWKPDLRISSGPIAKVAVTLAHLLTHEQRGLRPYPQTDQERLENTELAGYRAVIHPDRTEQSFCLGALLACSIATLNRTRIIDDEGRLGHGGLVDPAAVADMFAKHGDAETFEQLADRFCAGIVSFGSD